MGGSGVGASGAGASGGGAGAAPSGGQGGLGGEGAGGDGGRGPVDLDELLERLREDFEGTALEESRGGGWPVVTDEGPVVVSDDPAWTLVAGDFDDWAGSPLSPDEGFSWAVVDLEPGDAYKLTDGLAYAADPWARSYQYDDFGEKSLFAPAAAHLDRHFVDGISGLPDRVVRVWVPVEPPTHVLYVHDGQNLFDPEASWGGWKLAESAPPAMLLVGIDNTPLRMDEYTHVPDDIGLPTPVGGEGDLYAELLQSVVRPLVAAEYVEPATVGIMGSSLGGLISLHVANRHPGEYTFAASLSGTLGWGKIGDLGHETMLERYAAAGHGATAIFLDSGGGGPCVDADGDGVEDDHPDSADNYCETVQMQGVLAALGYQTGVDLWHWHEPGAPHNEAAWAARVFRPLEAFAGL